MPLETATVPVDLNPLWPLGADPKSQGDDHIRMIKTVIQSMMPVGSIIMNNGTNPAAIWGGTWEQIEGRMVVGVGTSTSTDGRTWALDEEDGNETHTLTTGQMPSHTHGSGSYGTNTTGNHSHSVQTYIGSGQAGDNRISRSYVNGIPKIGSGAVQNAGSHSHTVNDTSGSSGGGNAHNNLPPVVAKYIWERTA